MKTILALSLLLLTNKLFFPLDQFVMQNNTSVNRSCDSLIYSTTNDTIKIGDSIIVHFNCWLPKMIGIIDPGNRYYIIISLEEKEIDTNQVISYKMLESDRVLYISTMDLRAIPWVYGESERELIFSKEGNYTFVFSDNLESDNSYSIRIKYYLKLR